MVKLGSAGFIPHAFSLLSKCGLKPAKPVCQPSSLPRSLINKRLKLARVNHNKLYTLPYGATLSGVITVTHLYTFTGIHDAVRATLGGNLLPA